MTKPYPITKTNDTYLINFGTHEMVYDKNGQYLGQWQEDYESDELGGSTFTKAIDGGIMFRGVVVPIGDLTASEMEKLEFVG